MPYSSEWVEPDVFLHHGGVMVYHTYKDDDYEQGSRSYWFTVNSACGEGSCGGMAESCTGDCHNVFDVRDLPAWKNPERQEQHPPFMGAGEDNSEANQEAWRVFHTETEPGLIKRAIMDAIDNGLLTENGIVQAA